MPPINFSRDFFYPKSDDGNLSLSTQEARIHEAILSLNPGDWIELEDGTRCTTEEELIGALSDKTVFNNQTSNKMDKNKNACKGFNSRDQLRWNCKTSLIVLLIILIIIPPLLNWVLRWDVKCGPIIGGERSSEIWLTFWGSYLAAIGSLVMACVSFIQNQKILKQNGINEQYRYEYDIYNKAEEYVLENNNLYRIQHFLTFSCMLLQSSEEGTAQTTQDTFLRVRAAFLSYQNKLNNTVTKYNKLRIGRNKNPYYAIIVEYNKTFLELSEVFHVLIFRFGGDMKTTSYEYQSYIEFLNTQKIINSTSELDIKLLLRSFVVYADYKIKGIPVAKSLFEAGSNFLDEQLEIIKQLREEGRNLETNL